MIDLETLTPEIKEKIISDHQYFSMINKNESDGHIIISPAPEIQDLIKNKLSKPACAMVFLLACFLGNNYMLVASNKYWTFELNCDEAELEEIIAELMDYEVLKVYKCKLGYAYYPSPALMYCAKKSHGMFATCLMTEEEQLEYELPGAFEVPESEL